MKEIKRTANPAYLSNCEELGKEYAAKRIKIKKAKPQNFNWHGLYDFLLSDLSLLTQNHCSYCDLSGVRRGQTSPTIDHFRPKSKFPLLAYTWGNLFLCCTECQKRNANFSELLIKPDEADYKFDNYFIINTITGEIEPNITKSKENQKRAKITIQTFNLNDNERPKYRLEVLKQYQGTQNPVLNDFSYRFFIVRATPIYQIVNF